MITFVKDRKGHDLRDAIYFSKLKNKLNWEPILSINDAVNLTSDWYIKKFDGHTQDKIAIEQIYDYEKKVVDNYYG